MNYSKTTVHYMGIAILCIASNILAFIFQLLYNELPCPLCLLQRFGFIAIGFGATMSLIRKPSWKFDLVILLSTIFTLVVALRQVLLHIKPNDAGYGSTFLGLHFYTWSAITAFFLILLIASSGIINFMFRNLKITHSKILLIGLKIAFIIIIFLNIVSTFFECGFGLCPSDPVSYMTWEDLIKNFKND